MADKCGRRQAWWWEQLRDDISNYKLVAERANWEWLVVCSTVTLTLAKPYLPNLLQKCHQLWTKYSNDQDYRGYLIFIEIITLSIYMEHRKNVYMEIHITCKGYVYLHTHTHIFSYIAVIETFIHGGS